jgi:hypothetical protein
VDASCLPSLQKNNEENKIMGIDSPISTGKFGFVLKSLRGRVHNNSCSGTSSLFKARIYTVCGEERVSRGEKESEVSEQRGPKNKCRKIGASRMIFDRPAGGRGTHTNTPHPTHMAGRRLAEFADTTIVPVRS